MLLLAGISTLASAQQPRPINSICLRFASDFNYFHRSRENDLQDHFFSTGIFGVFYRSFTQGRGLEAGVNVNYKNASGSGFPNLPLVMRDFDPGRVQNVGVTSVEMELKVGPRYEGIHPKIGYILGYRIQNSGFLEDGSSLTVNPVYLQLPFGCSFNFPTQYGAVGVGAFFELDVSNTMKVSGFGTGFNGGRQHAFNVEVTVGFDTRQR